MEMPIVSRKALMMLLLFGAVHGDNIEQPRLDAAKKEVEGSFVAKTPRRLESGPQIDPRKGIITQVIDLPAAREGTSSRAVLFDFNPMLPPYDLLVDDTDVTNKKAKIESSVQPVIGEAIADDNKAKNSEEKKSTFYSGIVQKEVDIPGESMLQPNKDETMNTHDVGELVDVDMSDGVKLESRESSVEIDINERTVANNEASDPKDKEMGFPNVAEDTTNEDVAFADGSLNSDAEVHPSQEDGGSADYQNDQHNSDMLPREVPTVDADVNDLALTEKNEDPKPTTYKEELEVLELDATRQVLTANELSHVEREEGANPQHSQEDVDAALEFETLEIDVHEKDTAVEGRETSSNSHINKPDMKSILTDPSVNPQMSGYNILVEPTKADDLPDGEQEESVLTTPTDGADSKGQKERSADGNDMDTAMGEVNEDSHDARIVKTSHVEIEGDKIQDFKIVQIPLGENDSGDRRNPKQDIDNNHVFEVLEGFKDDDGNNDHDIISVETFQNEDKDENNIVRDGSFDDGDVNASSSIINELDACNEGVIDSAELLDQEDDETVDEKDEIIIKKSGIAYSLLAQETHHSNANIIENLGEDVVAIDSKLEGEEVLSGDGSSLPRNDKGNHSPDVSTEPQESLITGKYEPIPIAKVSSAANANTKKARVNYEFVHGLDDLHKFVEEVDPPDELDVGADGSSMQEVLMSQGVHILKKRVSMGVSHVQRTIALVHKKARQRLDKKSPESKEALTSDSDRKLVAERREGPFNFALVSVKKNKEQLGKTFRAVRKVCMRFVDQCQSIMEEWFGW